MRTLPTLIRAVAVVALGAALVACGDDGDTVTEGTPAPPEAAGASGAVVVTTNILGDVVGNLVGDAIDVEVIMPAGADPHDFAPSARQAAAMRSADLLIVNGLGFEEGLLSAIEGAEEDGVVVYAATSAITTIDVGEGGRAHGHDEDDDHGHEDDDHGHEDDDHGHEDDDHGHADDDHGHSHDGDDPHFFTDPARMAVAVEGIADALAAHVEGLEGDEFRARVDGYVADLRALDAEIEALVDGLAEERRVLITNHEVFGYFADRYGFEVLGTVIPGGSTLAEPSAADLAALAKAMEDEGVRAVFAETSAPARLADALAAEVGGDVEVVELFSESLGEPGSGGETYIGMMRTNAERIVAALS